MKLSRALKTTTSGKSGPQGPLIRLGGRCFCIIYHVGQGSGPRPVLGSTHICPKKISDTVLLTHPMNFSNFLHAALNRRKNDFFLMTLFDWTSRCCTFWEVGGVRYWLFEKNCQKIPLFIRKKIFFQERSNNRQRCARLGNQSAPGW